MKRFACLAAFLSAALWAGAQPPLGNVVFGNPKDGDWRPPTNLPTGAEYVLVREDPATHGIHALVRFPSGYAVPSHSHSCSETLVVLKGRLEVSAGGAVRTLSAGDYVVLPAGTAHALKTKGWGRAVFTATTDAPYDLKPVSP